MHSILWQNPSEVGAERCTLVHRGDGHVISGTALVSVDGAPCELRYTVRADGSWRTRHVEVERFGPADDARLVVDVGDDGRWRVDGDDQADLDGCADIDLEFSPATNMLPIRRLDLPVGSGADLDAAWLRYPGLRVERARQHYHRLAEDRCEFRAGDFAAELTFDQEGLVRTYGDFWRQVAST
jgi:hypothetical protein